MPSPAEVAAYAAIIGQISDLATDKVAALVAAAPTRETLVEAYPEVLDPYLAAATQVSTEWYQSLAPDEPFEVDTPAPIAREALVANARWAVTELDAVEALVGSADRQVFTAARDTVAHNARMEGVRFARRPQPDACAWCRMLATRGADYFTKANAEKGHAGCRCAGVADRPGNPYVEPDYVGPWHTDYNNAALAESGTDDVVNNMRRKRYAERSDEINAQQRKWYRARKDRAKTAPVDLDA